MAIEIEFLRGLSKESQTKFLNEMSLKKNSVPIQIDGEVFWIDSKVQDLIDSLSHYIEDLGGKLNY